MLQHPGVVDCAVVGLEDSLKGHVPLALCVLRKGKTHTLALVSESGCRTLNHFNSTVTPHITQVCVCPHVCVCASDLQRNPEVIVKEIVSLVRETVGPVAAFRKVLFVTGLPKTRSGKIPRSSLANLVNNKPYKVP